MTDRLSRNRFSFRLKTLLIMVLAASPPLAWLGNACHWIRQRQATLQTGCIFAEPYLAGVVRAPGGLGLLGEPGYAVIFHYDTLPGAISREKLVRLFPESRVITPVQKRW